LYDWLTGFGGKAGAGGRGQRQGAGGRGQGAEGRGQGAEGRGQRAESKERILRKSAGSAGKKRVKAREAPKTAGFCNPGK